MAVAFRSVATTNIADRNGSAWSVTITKPAGLAVSDYMIAIIGTSTNASAEAITGWTLWANQQNGVDERILVYGKVADSSDVAATDFTFTVHTGNGGSNDGMGGCLIATSGDAPITISTFVDTGTSTGTTQTYTGGITPTLASLLIMGTWGQGASTTVSNYAITTDNGTWTERMDDNQALGVNDYTMAVATSPRTAVTATGSFTCDYASAVDSVGVLLAILETTNVTVSPTVISLVSSVQAPAVTGSAVVSPAVITATASVQAPTVTTSLPKWTNPDKSNTSPTITNPDKTV